MCILFVHVNPDPERGQYRLVLASNRDESYKRPTKPAGKVETTSIIGAVDMEPGKAGGMQLGFTNKVSNSGDLETYCVGALLNMRSPVIENPIGRGWLVRDYLSSGKDFPAYIDGLELKRYMGFNLVGIEISADGTAIYQQCNTPHVFSRMIGKHTVGFSNSHPLSPLQKVSAGRYKFEEVIEKKLEEGSLIDELFNIIKDKTQNLPDADLQKQAPMSFKQISSICVPITKFGTLSRSHTVILIDYDWNLRYIEHAMEDPIDPEQPKWVVNDISYNLKTN